MKVAFFDIKDFEKEYFEKNLPPIFERSYTNKSLNYCVELTDFEKNTEIISVFIESELSCNVLTKFPNLKYIVLRSTGFSHVDLLYAKEHNIKVFNAPHYGDSSIAEYVFALLFTLSRNIVASSLALKNQSVEYSKFQGIELREKTIGIVGLGAIGKKVYDIASAIGMKVIYNDIKETPNHNFVSIDKLCTDSDIISINCPLTCETLHLFDESKFHLMKNGVIIINTARGEIIKTCDLYRALLSEKIKYAGLDVIECENILYEDKNNPIDVENVKSDCLRTFYVTKRLLEMDNVLITPHNAYNTIEAKKRILDITIENLISLTKFTNGAKNLVLI